MIKICIIGGGASGMLAAISAAREGASVTLFEKNDRLGKKILSTGNGKCNYTNEVMNASFYHSSTENGLIADVLSRFSEQDTIHFFEGLGIVPKVRMHGLYPNSETAVSIVDALRLEMENLGIKVYTGCGKVKVDKNEKSFIVRGESFDRCIVAVGGKAAPKTGSDGDGYFIAKKFGIDVVDALPALVPLKSDANWLKEVSGVRAASELSLYINNKFIHKSIGELQLTDYGISGICTFELSSEASKAIAQGKKCFIYINFLPDHTKEEVFELLQKRAEVLKKRSMAEFFIGLFNSKLSNVFIKKCGIKAETSVEKLTDKQLMGLADAITALYVPIIDTCGFDKAQTTSGGISLNELNKNFESCKVPGLYFIGEVTDVDGICGGYNLQWAWAGGFIAGKAAANDKD